ncbi:MAG TPA: hypothetical protein VF767_07750 [Bryobacteraceae bacterium]
MPDYGDILNHYAADQRGEPQVRMYLESEQRPAEAELAARLEGYEIVAPLRGSQTPYEMALIRKVVFESEEQFRTECLRVASLVSPLLTGSASLGCLYDSSEGGSAITRYGLNLRKTGANPEMFVVTRAPESE